MLQGVCVSRRSRASDSFRASVSASVGVSQKRPTNYARAFVSSHAVVPLRASCFLADSFPAARSRKRRRTSRALFDLCSRGPQLRKRLCQIFAPVAPRRLVFFPRASVDQGFPRL